MKAGEQSAMVVIGHPLEHAMVGQVYVPDTREQTDAQVRARTGLHRLRTDQAVAVRRSKYCVVCKESTPCSKRRKAVSER